MEALPKIVLCIPGPWSSADAVGRAILDANDALILSGSLLLNTADDTSAQMEMYGHDPQLRRAFELSAYEPFEPQFLDAVAAHTFVLYLVGTGGSLAAARTMMHLASELLRAGGIGVKVESSAVSHSRSAWEDLAAQKPALALYEAFVTFVRGQESYYSCGMHNLGLPDARVPVTLPPPEAWRLLQSFEQFMLLENPPLEPESIFKPTIDGPGFILHRETCTLYSEDDLLFNPYGLWHLEKV